MALRIAPFAIFVCFTAMQGLPGTSAPYWVYLGKTLLGAFLLWLVHPLVPEVRWNFSVEAVIVGVLVVLVWVGLDPFYRHLGIADRVWNPQAEFGENSALAWLMIAGRIAGSTLVVPPLEEMFYRSFLYRYVVRPEFEQVPLNYFRWTPMLVMAVVFGMSHHEWLAGILCAMAYQWLVIRKNRLGDAIAAHAITNFLLGIWVVWRGAWNFW